jgi:DNA primase
MEYPDGVKDVDDVLRKLSPDAFAQMIATARPHTSWIIQNVDNFGATLETPEGQQEVAELLLEMLASLPVIERAARVKELAERCGITEELLRKALNEIYVRRYPQRLKPRKLASMVIP